MDKRIITLFAFLGITIGASVPILLGWDPTGLGGPSILGGFIGGITAIVSAVKLSRS